MSDIRDNMSSSQLARQAFKPGTVWTQKDNDTLNQRMCEEYDSLIDAKHTVEDINQQAVNYADEEQLDDVLDAGQQALQDWEDDRDNRYYEYMDIVDAEWNKVDSTAAIPGVDAETLQHINGDGEFANFYDTRSGKGTFENTLGARAEEESKGRSAHKEVPQHLQDVAKQYEQGTLLDDQLNPVDFDK